MVQHYYQELVGFFSHTLRNRDAATDIVQECYARVLAMDPSVAIAEPRALLYKIGKNLIVDDARRRNAEARMLATLALTGSDELPSVEHEVMVRQQLDRLLARLARMPGKRREAFIMVRVYGYSHREAAEHLCSSVAAIEKHVVRAVLDCIDMTC
ncbi:sigma-70 family RNA polymerase sigma factor [Undibacterium sp. CY18W]|uniref:Sigma-70 family RNA polymerase sigma factor n=1 Tax=Undibacterium hunanense TaxID=2762292 RepID=A0ABR6ZXH0_9BURK|nr:sigma-70 family RNA polymerase sigma factor [Undibacterium hunanense]MBC3920545.1 sigma-70 family RNA polymerase sigma factor [Undibacterium hunanense]